MTLEVFSHLNDSMIPQRKEYPHESHLSQIPLYTYRHQDQSYDEFQIHNTQQTTSK